MGSLARSLAACGRMRSGWGAETCQWRSLRRKVWVLDPIDGTKSFITGAACHVPPHLGQASHCLGPSSRCYTMASQCWVLSTSSSAVPW